LSILSRRFYSRKPTIVARELIGKELVRILDNGQRLSGLIVEAEAYGGARDPASHAYIGKTKRNAVMFGEAGHAYIYFTYGFHHCLNFVTGRNGIASAVLIRAIEPKEGIETMLKLRKKTKVSEIASGPGKVCQAFSIDSRLNGVDVTRKDSPIQVLDAPAKGMRVSSSRRIGISVARSRMWRFYVKGNVHVSRNEKLL
jgi:DNA-3-methyladenine glycosylase